MKAQAKENMFKSAATIVEQVMNKDVDRSAPNPSLPSAANLARRTNRMRQKMRPADPTDIKFEVR